MAGQVKRGSGGIDGRTKLLGIVAVVVVGGGVAMNWNTIKSMISGPRPGVRSAAAAGSSTAPSSSVSRGMESAVDRAKAAVASVKPPESTPLPQKAGEMMGAMKTISGTQDKKVDIEGKNLGSSELKTVGQPDIAPLGMRPAGTPAQSGGAAPGAESVATGDAAGQDMTVTPGGEALVGKTKDLEAKKASGAKSGEGDNGSAGIKEAQDLGYREGRASVQAEVQRCFGAMAEGKGLFAFAEDEVVEAAYTRFTRLSEADRISKAAEIERDAVCLLTLYPASIPLHDILGSCLFLRKQYKEAAVEFDYVQEKAPKSVTSWEALCMNALSKAKLNDAGATESLKLAFWLRKADTVQWVRSHPELRDVSPRVVLEFLE